ncbi:MarR family transcriptional regulator [Dactylosporangium sp. CA-233914]|uniref:MarR family transcriptional regulator n=1 Tax=Dactylosporangium sp. CA-233914 TaxID=3239934 RepID=UPI003D93BC5B
MAAAFYERFVALMVETGLPRMAARVLAALVTTDEGALTAAGLVQRLRVSPASVSKAIAYLEKLDIVRREREAQRRERYVIDDDVWLRTWLTNARLHAMWSDSAREGAEVYGRGTQAGERLERMGRFFAALSEEMSGGQDLAVVNDVLTIVAALVHAAAPCTAGRLAEALGWSAQRVENALELGLRRSDFVDPVAIHRHGEAAYVAAAGETRLSSRQRAGLRAG